MFIKHGLFKNKTKQKVTIFVTMEHYCLNFLLSCKQN